MVDNSGNVFVTGYSIGSGSGYDYATIKLSQTTNIQVISNLVPYDFQLENNYPNPFNPLTSIKFSLPKYLFVKLSISNILGNVLNKLVNNSLNAGTYKVDWNASNYPSGIYFYSIQTETFSATKKMVLLK